MNERSASPARGTAQRRWMQQWQRAARRIRVPLGFLTAGFYLYELWRQAPHPAAIAWSAALVAPGLALRGYASGCVKKDRALTMTGPYAHTRNPLYLGSMLVAAGFALALESWLVAAVLAAGFAVIYVPVIAAEERFLRSIFPEYEAYCRSVPRLIPRFRPARPQSGDGGTKVTAVATEGVAGGFSPALYMRHREYNAAIGAALLYLSLLFLRPVLAAILRGAR
jgi:protein-S-isoprenylcysteine O-methyltransferase Ste14